MENPADTFKFYLVIVDVENGNEPKIYQAFNGMHMTRQQVYDKFLNADHDFDEKAEDGSSLVLSSEWIEVIAWWYENNLDDYEACQSDNGAAAFFCFKKVD